MELSELIKIKPGTILYIQLEELITEDLKGRCQKIFDTQEICIQVKSVSFFPSRKDCKMINIHFKQADLYSDVLYDDFLPAVEKIQYLKKDLITAEIKYGNIYSTANISSIELE